MTDLDNGLLHEPLHTQLKAAHQSRARYISGLVQGLWAAMTGSKPTSGKATTTPGQSAA